MSRTLRALLCAASMLAVASSANAQTAPATGTPAACQVTAPTTPTTTTSTAAAASSEDDAESHGDDVRDCIEALREAGEHGFGHIISEVARQNGEEHYLAKHDGDDAGVQHTRHEAQHGAHSHDPHR